MKAVALSEYLEVTQNDCFKDVELALPELSPRDILVKVEAVSINPVDTKVRRPKVKVEDPPRVLGWDASGTVEETGADCTLFQKGDKVFYAGDISRSGSNAEYQVVDERIVGQKPKTLSFAEAAAIPLTALTAWEVLFERLHFVPEPNNAKNDRSLLIIAGAGGVGSIATQMAKSIAGVSTVISTASRPESKKWCEEMGANHVINHREALLPQLQKLGLGTVDAIFCCAPTEMYFDQFRDLITPQGHIASIVETTSDVPLPMNSLQGKSASFAWGFMFTRSLHKTKDIQKQNEILNAVAGYLDDGVLTSTMTENLGAMTAQTLRDAHAKIEKGSVIGKVVLDGIKGD